MTSLRIALKQSLEESSGGFSPSPNGVNSTNVPSNGSGGTNGNHKNTNGGDTAHPHEPLGSSTATSGVPSSPLAVKSHNSSSNLQSQEQAPHSDGSSSGSPVPASHMASSSGQLALNNKKRGPGRPRKQAATIEGPPRKRGRPKKQSTTSAEEEGGGHSEPEMSVADEEGENPEKQTEEERTTAANKIQSHWKKKKVPTAATAEPASSANEEPPPPVPEPKAPAAPEVKESNTETSQPTQPPEPVVPNDPPQNAVEEPASSNVAAHPTQMAKQISTGSIANDAGGGRKVDDSEERILVGRGKPVPPPAPEILEWMRSLPMKQARQSVSQGFRLKVRFTTRVKKEGKFVKRKKWYGGLVSQVSKAGSKIRIKYDDGTTEISKFPDKDVIVDDTSNGKHQGSADFFVPDERTKQQLQSEREANEREQKKTEGRPQQPERRTSNPEEHSYKQTDLAGEGSKDEALSAKARRKRGRPPKGRQTSDDAGSKDGETFVKDNDGSETASVNRSAADNHTDPSEQREAGADKALTDSKDKQTLGEMSHTESRRKQLAARQSDSKSGDSSSDLAAKDTIGDRVSNSSKQLEIPSLTSESSKGDLNEQAPKRSHIHLSRKGYDGSRSDPQLSNGESYASKPTVSPIRESEVELKAPPSPRLKKVKRKRAEHLSPKPSHGDSYERNSSSILHSERKVSADSDDDGVETRSTPRARSKPDAVRSGRRAAQQANERISSKQDLTLLEQRKRKKRDRRKEFDGDDSDAEEPPQSQWVQCDRCKKWRIIPSVVVDSLPNKWFCENNEWDPKRASCDAPQQKDKQHVRDRKRKKRQRLMEKSNEGHGDAHQDGNSDGSHHGPSHGRDEEDDRDRRVRRGSPTEVHHSDSSSVHDQNKSEKRLHLGKKKGSSHHSSEPIDEDGESKPRGRGRPRRNASAKEANESLPRRCPNADEGDNLEWVQCEKCDKWRKLPPHISADELPDVWYCSLNTWNPASASCSAPEDKADGLQDIFNNPGSGGGKLSYRNLIFGNGRKFNRPVSERTRAAESLFAAVSDDTDAPPTAMYANSSAFISRSKLNQLDDNETFSVLDLMSHSYLWSQLRTANGGTNVPLTDFDRMTEQTKESMKDLILHSLGSRTLTGDDVHKEIQERNWQNVPLGWAAAQPYCSISTIVMTMCELVREGVLECYRKVIDGNKQNFVLCYKRAKSHSNATLDQDDASTEMDDSEQRCMKFAKPWKMAHVM